MALTHGSLACVPGCASFYVVADRGRREGALEMHPLHRMVFQQE